jgi:hypothetical protein
MITFENLSKRIFQFFDTIFSIDKTSFGFSSVSGEAYREERIDQDIRPSYDYSSTDFINSDLNLIAFQTILSSQRTIDNYILNILGITISDLQNLTIDQLTIGLNTILPISDFYNNIDIQNFILDPKINFLLQEAQTGNLIDITAIRRLNKMLLCSIYNIQILTSSIYLAPINISTLLFYRIEDEMMGNGIASNFISYDDNGNEIINALKNVSVIVNILSKKFLAKDATNFFNFAIQSERKIIASYSQNFDFDLILYNKDEPQVLTELEKGAWAERVEQKLYFKYIDNLTLDIVPNLNNVGTVYQIPSVYQYSIKTKGD